MDYQDLKVLMVQLELKANVETMVHLVKLVMQDVQEILVMLVTLEML